MFWYICSADTYLGIYFLLFKTSEDIEYLANGVNLDSEYVFVYISKTTPLIQFTKYIILLLYLIDRKSTNSMLELVVYIHENIRYILKQASLKHIIELKLDKIKEEDTETKFLQLKYGSEYGFETIEYSKAKLKCKLIKSMSKNSWLNLVDKASDKYPNFTTGDLSFHEAISLKKFTIHDFMKHKERFVLDFFLFFDIGSKATFNRTRYKFIKINRNTFTRDLW